MQLLKEELQQSRVQQEEVLQMNQILIKKVEDLQALEPMTSSREYISSSSLPASPPITNGPETQHNFQNADATSLSSPANFFVPFVFEYCDLFQPAHRAYTSSEAPVSVENHLSSSQKIYTTKPLFHWLPNGVSGANDAPPSGTSMTLNDHQQILLLI